MERAHSPHVSLMWYNLSEAEWYGVSGVRRREIERDLAVEAQAGGYRFANIFVTPDPVLSVSPEPVRHMVYKWTAKPFKPEVETLDYWKQRALEAERKLATYEQ